MKMHFLIAAVCLLYLKTAHGQCGQGWVLYGNSCYHVSHDKETWAGADYMCHKLGGYLVEVNTAEEGHFLEHQVQLFQFADAETWIGATDILIEGEFVWANSNIKLSSHSYTNWLPGDPNNAFGNENCVCMFNSGLWVDEQCWHTVHYICEKEPVHGNMEFYDHRIIAGRITMNLAPTKPDPRSVSCASTHPQHTSTAITSVPTLFHPLCSSCPI